MPDGGDHQPGDVLEEAGGGLHRDQQDHCQPVEHVVDGGAGEGPPELLPVLHLCEGHDGVGDAGADVGSHDHGDGGPHWHIRRHEAHNDGGGGGGGLGDTGCWRGDVLRCEFLPEQELLQELRS